MKIVCAVDADQGVKGLLLPVMLDEVLEEYQLTIMGNDNEDDPILIILDFPKEFQPVIQNALNTLFGEPKITRDVDMSIEEWLDGNDA